MFRVKKKKKTAKINLAVVYIFSSLSFYGTLPNFLGMFHLHQKKWPGMQARKLWAGLSPGVLGRDQRNIRCKTLFGRVTGWVQVSIETHLKIYIFHLENWRYQWISFYINFSLYPLSFATFLYSHVFLYINILTFFCRSLFIKVIFSRLRQFFNDLAHNLWRACIIPLLMKVHLQSNSKIMPLSW